MRMQSVCWLSVHCKFCRGEPIPFSAQLLEYISVFIEIYPALTCKILRGLFFRCTLQNSGSTQLHTDRDLHFWRCTLPCQRTGQIHYTILLPEFFSWGQMNIQLFQLKFLDSSLISQISSKQTLPLITICLCYAHFNMQEKIVMFRLILITTMTNNVL